MIIGTETELLLCPDRPCAGDDKKALISAVLGRVKEIVPAVQNQEFGQRQEGFMTANGSRIYRDADCIEIATPETESPLEALVYQKANELILQRALPMPAGPGRYADNIRLTKASTDYHGHFQGFHINLSSKNWDVAALVEHLVPFLVTRFYACAGGLGSQGLVMSQKHSSVRTVASPDARTNRGIVNLKQEYLSATFKRIHVTHGDLCMSELANFLALGTTALIVKMLDDGVCIGPAYKLLDPIRALETLDQDFSWTAPLPLASGSVATALQIQKHYLKAAKIYAGTHREVWMKEVVRLWQRVIQMLEKQGPAGLCRLLDPYIKFRFYSICLKQAGLTLNEFSHWSYPVIVAQGLVGKNTIDVRGLLLEKMPYVSFLFLEEHMSRCNLAWPQLPEAIALYNKMLVLDLMFHDISSAGIYHRLSETVAIDHEATLIDPSKVRAATQQPPIGTRAQARGRAIREVAAEKGSFADWTCVCTDHRQMVMPDPGIAEYPWQPLIKKGTRRP